MTYGSKEVILEVRRVGRRPRYHRGAVQAGTGERLDSPRCNLDDVRLEVRQLDALPERIPHPWSQLCARCWAGTEVLSAALALGDAYRAAAPARRAARMARARA